MMTILTFLLLAMLSVDATCASDKQTWRRVELKRNITHPQPPLYRDAWFSIGDTRSTASLRGLLPGDEMTVEIPAVPRADGSNLRIVSDHILPQQQIEFVAGRK